MKLVNFVVVSIILTGSLAFGYQHYQELYRWKAIDVAWPSSQDHAYERNEYIPSNNPIAGIKIWRNHIYLTVPRWKDGVPVTLGVISAMPVNKFYSPGLEAYPDWDMQRIGDCRAFQSVPNIEIDPKGRMWILDTGRTETMTSQPKARCPPRLVILDLEKNGKILRSYPFPANVTLRNTSELNDIVLDHEFGGYAYITDSDPNDPGIIVFSLDLNSSWKIRHDTMKAQTDASHFKIGRIDFERRIGVYGIALSPAGTEQRLVYYSPLSSYDLYSLPTSILRSSGLANVHDFVRKVGTKKSQTSGMIMSSKGILYYGQLTDSSVYSWNTEYGSGDFTSGQHHLLKDDDKMQWPNSFAFDERGTHLYFITNSLHKFLTNQVDITVPNYRIIKLSNVDGARSYQYYKGLLDVPGLPSIVAGADCLTIALSNGLLVLFVFIVK